jgi:hypothetical protein
MEGASHQVVEIEVLSCIFWWSANDLVPASHKPGRTDKADRIDRIDRTDKTGRYGRMIG